MDPRLAFALVNHRLRFVQPEQRRREFNIFRLHEGIKKGRDN